MIISVVNQSQGTLEDADVQRAIRAVNRQIEGDFAAAWGFGAALRLEGKTGSRARGFDPGDVRGDAVLYLETQAARMAEADGFHTANLRGIPYGFVFLDVSRKLKEDWTVTLSHEALELLGDPENNLLAQGPHPDGSKGQVFHWFEMCDAVQNETYAIDGIEVSNFVLPLYFTSSNERGGRNDFLGTAHGPRRQTLTSFGINPGGYINYFDPKSGTDQQAVHDKRGLGRLQVKRTLGVGRGQVRQRRHVD